MKKEGFPADDVSTLSIVVEALAMDYVSFTQLESVLPSLLVNRVKAIQKQGEKNSKFDMHRYSTAAVIKWESG